MENSLFSGVPKFRQSTASLQCAWILGPLKNINFPFEKNGKLLILGVPILKHFRACQTLRAQITLLHHRTFFWQVFCCFFSLTFKLTFSCTPNKDIHVFHLYLQIISPMLSHPGPDKNHVYLMHWLYRKTCIYVVKWRWFLQPLRQKMTSLYAN